MFQNLFYPPHFIIRYPSPSDRHFTETRMEGRNEGEEENREENHSKLSFTKIGCNKVRQERMKLLSSLGYVK